MSMRDFFSEMKLSYQERLENWFHFFFLCCHEMISFRTDLWTRTDFFLRCFHESLAKRRGLKLSFFNEHLLDETGTTFSDSFEMKFSSSVEEPQMELYINQHQLRYHFEYCTNTFIEMVCQVTDNECIRVPCWVYITERACSTTDQHLLCLSAWYRIWETNRNKTDNDRQDMRAQTGVPRHWRMNKTNLYFSDKHPEATTHVGVSVHN